MDTPPIYTKFNVPAATSYPSLKCLQWSADGQACFATKTAVYIMAPDHGINFDLSSAIKPLEKREDRNSTLSVGWFRTIVPLSKSGIYKWPEHSQAWGAVSLGSLDVALWDFSFSPSGLSSDSGCILATLTSNMDLCLWTATKNGFKGEWVKAYDVTPFLLELSPGEDDALARGLKAQTTCIDWSRQVDFGLAPTPAIDGSLLVAGNRAGFLVFLRYHTEKMIQHVHTVQVAEIWLTHVAFSPWVATKTGTCEAYVSYATSDGAVGLVKVTQALESSTDPSAQILDLDVTFDHAPNLCDPNGRGITALSWLEVPRKGVVLVYCNPGMIHIWCPPSPNFGWSGHRSFRFHTGKLSIGSSSLHPTTGIQYIRRLDVLVLTLYDGSFHVVYRLSSEPSMHPNNEELVTSQGVSTAVRSAFLKVEPAADFNDMNRIPGSTSYDDNSTFVWVQEATRPANFSYKQDSQQNSTLVVSSVWAGPSDDHLIQDLTETLNTAKTSAGIAPLSILRPFFFHLRSRAKLNALHSRILDILKPQSENLAVKPFVPSWPTASAQLRSAFRRSLIENLFGWDAILSLRLRLALADFVWKYSDTEEKQLECGHVAQNLITAISHHTLRTVIEHLIAVVNSLTPDDIPFVLRMVVQSLLPGSPEDLSVEGHNLQLASQALLFPDPRSTPATNSFNELCPACRAEVPLQDIRSAVCPNGHTWARCSITTFILSTPYVRTCIGCSRKAFLPSSTRTANQLPEVARGWVAEELIEVVRRCLFCNNSFVSVL